MNKAHIISLQEQIRKQEEFNKQDELFLEGQRDYLRFLKGVASRKWLQTS